MFWRRMFCLFAVWLTCAGCGEDGLRFGWPVYNEGPVPPDTPPLPIPPDTATAPAPTPVPSTGPQPLPTPTPVPVPSPVALAVRVAELTDAFRIENGLTPLTVNPELTGAAQAYAEQMAQEGFFDHTAPDGGTPGARLSVAGYRWATWGENLAVGYATADEAVKAWINSPPHRENLVNPRFTEIGIGHAIGNSPQYGPNSSFWVQEFGLRAPDAPKAPEPDKPDDPDDPRRDPGQQDDCGCEP